MLRGVKNAKYLSVIGKLDDAETLPSSPHPVRGIKWFAILFIFRFTLLVFMLDLSAAR